MSSLLHPRLFLVHLGLVLVCAGHAEAGVYQVNPVQIELSPSATSGLLTVSNHDAEPARYQVSTFAWRQGPDGKMELTPDQDLVFFPSFLSLGPGEARKIRIGTTVPFGAIEKTYRIVVEELPPLKPETGTLAVKVLTRMSVPVYLMPARPVVDARIERMTVDKGRLGFAVRNAGTVRFRANTVRVIARDERGGIVLEKSTAGWYVLSGGERIYHLDLPREQCARARSVEVLLEADRARARTELKLSAEACAQ